MAGSESRRTLIRDGTSPKDIKKLEDTSTGINLSLSRFSAQFQDNGSNFLRTSCQFVDSLEPFCRSLGVICMISPAKAKESEDSIKFCRDRLAKYKPRKKRIFRRIIYFIIYFNILRRSSKY